MNADRHFPCNAGRVKKRCEKPHFLNEKMATACTSPTLRNFILGKIRPQVFASIQASISSPCTITVRDLIPDCFTKAGEIIIEERRNRFSDFKGIYTAPSWTETLAESRFFSSYDRDSCYRANYPSSLYYGSIRELVRRFIGDSFVNTKDYWQYVRLQNRLIEKLENEYDSMNEIIKDNDSMVNERPTLEKILASEDAEVPRFTLAQLETWARE